LTDKFAAFEPFLTRWNLTADGEPIVTFASKLLPVRRGTVAAMLKVTQEIDERTGGELMRYWDGDGAARVLEYDGDGLLLERATGSGSLIAMVKDGRDDEASRIICTVAARLHAKRDKPLPELISLRQWFAPLAGAAERYGGILIRAKATASRLLDDEQDVTTLHGDLHHENILDFGPHGWLAIDPKRLIGERTFDFANIFSNPDRTTATAAGRLARQADIIAAAAQLDRHRLLQWIVAWSGLSAVWWLEDHAQDDKNAEPDLAIAKIAAAEIDKS
jgi:streptomycin 6-kinase